MPEAFVDRCEGLLLRGPLGTGRPRSFGWLAAQGLELARLGDRQFGFGVEGDERSPEKQSRTESPNVL